MNNNNQEKGKYVVEPGIAVSTFVEKINKLSYQDFPIDDVLTVLQKCELSLEFLEPYIFFSDARYTRNLIHKAKDFEVLLLCWNAGQHSPVHGHEGQKCWMRVVKGCLTFIDYQEEPDGSLMKLKEVSTKEGKNGFVDGPAVIHAVKNNTDDQALSLHLYAKPFDQCDIYDPVTSQFRKAPLNYHSVHGKLVAPEDMR